ncbi:MAG: MATE family efflux transporter, partial [Spirochaetales bacterium]|nr:MATE family efflux transporter [Spirochaetales bacterium]
MEEDRKTIQAENKLGIMPVGKLLVVMSVPTMFSMLIQAMYNIVDSIFVSHYSEKALTAVSLAFPMQMLMFSFAIGTSVGVCSVISRRLGERRLEEAQKAAQTGYTIELMLMVAFVLIGAFLSKPFIRLYTSDAELISMTSVYLQICMMLSIGSFVNVFCEKALQSTGDTIHPMIIQASGAIFNVIFDPILIFGYLGFPAMGVAGAAYATVAGQIFAMILGIVFLKRNRHLSVR